MSENVLITGSGSIVASHVIRHLVRESSVNRVIGIDPIGRHPYTTEFDDEVPVLPLDIRDEAALTRIMRKHQITLVLHVAAALGPWHNENPLLSVEVNLGGTMNVLESAYLAGARRVVFASTKSVYDGLTQSRSAVPEEVVHPTRPYTIGKVGAELLGSLMAASGSIEFAAVRFADFLCTEFCQRDTFNRAGAAFTLSKAIVAGIYGAPVRITAPAMTMTDPFYAGDLGRGVARLMLKDRLAHSAYNIGAGPPGTTYQEAIEALRARFGDETYLFEDTGTAAHRVVLDNTRMEDETGLELDRFDGLLASIERDVERDRARGALPPIPGRWMEQRGAVQLLDGY